MQKEKECEKGNAGKYIQYVAWTMFFLGIGFGFLAGYLEVVVRSDVGIFFMIGTTLAMGLSGLLMGYSQKIEREKGG